MSIETYRLINIYIGDWLPLVLLVLSVLYLSSKNQSMFKKDGMSMLLLMLLLILFIKGTCVVFDKKFSEQVNLVLLNNGYKIDTNVKYHDFYNRYEINKKNNKSKIVTISDCNNNIHFLQLFDDQLYLWDDCNDKPHEYIFYDENMDNINN